MTAEKTTSVKVPTENKNLVKRYIVGKNVTIGDYYAIAAAEKMVRDEAANNIETKEG